VRRLLRDAHSFPQRLASIAPDFSSEEAKGLAPFLLSCTEFQRVREKEVNECYEAFHSWLSAFYLFSVVADQVTPVMEELAKKEWLLRHLNGQADGAHRLSSITSSPRTSTSTMPGAPVAASNHGRVSRGSTSQRSGPTSSPLGKSRATLQGNSQQGPRVSAASTKTRPVAATLGEVSEVGQGRSPSPAQRARHGDSTLKQRGRATPGVGRTALQPQRALVPHGERTLQQAVRDTRGRRESHSPSQRPGRLSPTPASSPQQGPTVRSPSPVGPGRGPPSALQPRCSVDRPPLGTRDDAPSAGQQERRAFSPSRSVHVVKRMNSAPTTSLELGSRPSAVRSIKGGHAGYLRSGAGGSTLASPAGQFPSGSSAAGARSASSIRGAVRSSATSLRPTPSVVPPASTASASRGSTAIPVVPPLLPDQKPGGVKGEQTSVESR